MALDPAIKEGAPVGYYDDDRPVPSEPGSLPPEVQAPLLPFRGREPDAPAWFLDAIAQEPERSFVTSKGTQLELLTWGEVGKPGLLLVHGNSAHADWWSFIAPYLAENYRVASMSLAGMGASDWRETYAFQDFAEDAEACAHAAGLYAAGKPIYIGHSFGGSQVFYAAAAHPERMKAAIMVDVGFGGPPPDSPEGKRMLEEQAKRVANIPTPDRAQKVYPTIEAALARFRFMPPQVAGNLFVADFIARRSLKRAPMEDGSGEGWTRRQAEGGRAAGAHLRRPLGDHHPQDRGAGHAAARRRSGHRHPRLGPPRHGRSAAGPGGFAALAPGGMAALTLEAGLRFV